MRLALSTKMLLLDSMYMMTFIELGRGGLNSVFAHKSQFLFRSWDFPRQREGDMSNPKKKTTTKKQTRFIASPRNIQTIYSPCCCKQISKSTYELIISKIELEWRDQHFPIEIDNYLWCAKMFEIESNPCNTASVCIIIHHSHKDSVW